MVYRKSDFDPDRVIKGFEKEKRKQTLRKGAVAGRRNRAARAPRRRDWSELAGDTESDAVGFERIMPIDEIDRRRAVEQASADLSREGIGPGVPGHGTEPNARVVEVSREHATVLLDGDRLHCTLRGGLTIAESGERSPLAVGDYVLVTRLGPQQGVVEQIAPRHNELARAATGSALRKHVIAANIDQLLIVAAWRQPHFWPELVDRALIIAARAAISPLLAINKIDLLLDIEERQQVVAAYSKIGITVFETSAASGAGIGALRDALTGKTTALVGLSGVGKSSLLTAIEPGFDLKASAINTERGGQGRHTTTSAVLLPFAGGFVVDTPGIRELGLAGVAARSLARYYPELAALAGQCQFADCLHREEPGCAVRRGVGRGAISPMRYQSYISLLTELE